MKKITKILSVAVFILLLSACSKDSLTAKKLEGSWNISSLKINNTETISANSSAQITFTERKANEGRYNTKLFLGSLLISDVDGDYIVSDKGSKITLDDDDAAPGTGTILEITDSYLKTTYTDGDGNKVDIEADKK